MTQRREFNKGLRAVSERCNTGFFNPTKLIKRHGKDGVLDGGVSIYEYEESFYPTLGKALVRQMRAVALAPDARVSTANAGTPLAHLPLPEITRSALAMKMEAKMMGVARYLRRVSRKIGRGVGKLVSRRRATS
jgi:hypothetical protein